ncbi:Alpha/Beta hydrolase protein [Hyaloscypha sp. PMI_1271]|nr:Alpha/Beta hydrolase protein [Hyaloscypha sp. PMI_1271]
MKMSIGHSLPTTFDATKFGPKCPQPAHSSLIRVALSSPTVESDEFKCLNLNIPVPSEALSGKRQEERVPLLPVMVWVHGGQFKNGTNSNPQDPTQVLSCLANPVVVVQINYPLGIFGFLASSDLATEYESTTSKVPVCRANLLTSA